VKGLLRFGSRSAERDSELEYGTNLPEQQHKGLIYMYEARALGFFYTAHILLFAARLQLPLDHLLLIVALTQIDVQFLRPSLCTPLCGK
jgi:hypothetical protein